MASSQHSNQLKETQVEEAHNDLFDRDTREKSADALLSLLTHLKRQDEETESD